MLHKRINRSNSSRNTVRSNLNSNNLHLRHTDLLKADHHSGKAHLNKHNSITVDAVAEVLDVVDSQARVVAIMLLSWVHQSAWDLIMVDKPKRAMVFLHRILFKHPPQRFLKLINLIHRKASLLIVHLLIKILTTLSGAEEI